MFFYGKRSKLYREVGDAREECVTRVARFKTGSREIDDDGNDDRVADRKKRRNTLGPSLFYYLYIYLFFFFLLSNAYDERANDIDRRVRLFLLRGTAASHEKSSGIVKKTRSRWRRPRLRPKHRRDSDTIYKNNEL